MYRIDDPSASTTLPTPEAALTEGYWTEGNPSSGIPATLERASWFNMIQEELRAIVVAGGLTPSKTTYTQVLTAIRSLIGKNIQVYTTAGTYSFTIPAGITRMKGVATGAGGGTGGGDASHNGSGGGAGGTDLGWFNVTPGQVLTITVGAGGVATSGANPGGTGGTSSIAGFLSATGGSPGTANSATNNPGGAGGVGAGSAAIQGGAGTDSNLGTNNNTGGIGGASIYGGGGRASVNGGSPLSMNGQSPGSGAGGTYSNLGSTGGGKGFDGRVTLEW